MCRGEGGVGVRVGRVTVMGGGGGGGWRFIGSGGGGGGGVGQSDRGETL